MCAATAVRRSVAQSRATSAPSPAPITPGRTISMAPFAARATCRPTSTGACMVCGHCHCGCCTVWCCSHSQRRHLRSTTSKRIFVPCAHPMAGTRRKSLIERSIRSPPIGSSRWRTTSSATTAHSRIRSSREFTLTVNRAAGSPSSPRKWRRARQSSDSPFPPWTVGGCALHRGRRRHGCCATR